MNHVHLTSPDVAAEVAFLERYFGYRKTADHGAGVFLRNEDGFLIAIDPVEAAFEFPSWFHLGQCLGSAEAVRELHARMVADGVEIARKLLDFQGEAAAYYCLAPGGYRIEVSWHAEDA